MKAADEFEAAIAYVARDAPLAAKRLAQRIIGRIRSLRQSPNRGGFIPEDEGHRYRQLIEGSYRIIYRHEKGVVFISSIYHGARFLRLEDIEP
jgi:toxin ParE1/3/4